MQISYIAKTANGESTTGVVDALSLSEARRCLRERGLFPLNVYDQSATSATVTSSRSRPRGRKVRKADLLMITSQLAIMCRSGIDIAEALRSVGSDCRHERLKTTLNEVYVDVSNGVSASAALRRHVDVFGEAYVTSIAAAEASGTVTQVLTRLTDMLRNQVRLEGNLKGVAAYPIVLLAVAGLVILALIFFVLPQFAKVFVTLGRPAPPLTQFLLDSSTFIRSHALAIVIGTVLTIFALRKIASMPAARMHWDAFVLNFRLLRSATQSLLAGRSFRLLGAMLQSGVPLLEAVRLCKASIRNHVFRRMFDDIERDVVNGNGVGGAVARARFVPAGAAQMIGTAERTGRLGEVMELIGEYYEDEGEGLLRQRIKLLEPAIIVVMGVVVAGVVLSVVLPLLDVTSIQK